LEEQLQQFDEQEDLQEALRQSYFVKECELVEEPSEMPMDRYQRFDLEQSHRFAQEEPSTQREDHRQPCQRVEPQEV
jgi:hypothetical protein